jgi:hypothetical protein
MHSSPWMYPLLFVTGLTVGLLMPSPAAVD